MATLSETRVALRTIRRIILPLAREQLDLSHTISLAAVSRVLGEPIIRHPMFRTADENGQRVLTMQLSKKSVLRVTASDQGFTITERAREGGDDLAKSYYETAEDTIEALKAELEFAHLQHLIKLPRRVSVAVAGGLTIAFLSFAAPKAFSQEPQINIAPSLTHKTEPTAPAPAQQ